MLGYRRKINSMLRHRSSQLPNFGCVLKKGSKTQSSLRQSKLQLQNEAALTSCRIRAVEHRCAAGAHPGLQDRILLNYSTQELRMRIKHARILAIFCCLFKSRKVRFSFPLLRHYEMSECFYVKSCCFELVQQFHHATEIGNVANAVSACAEQVADKIETFISDKANAEHHLKHA